jgi:hypothetical protein
LLVELSIILVAASKASAVFSNFEKAFNFTTWCLYQVTVKFEPNKAQYKHITEGKISYSRHGNQFKRRNQVPLELVDIICYVK